MLRDYLLSSKAWDKKARELIGNGNAMDLYRCARSNGFVFDNDHYDLHDDIQFMQYTGLKDKNGKEIYEGDIVDYEKHNGYMLEGFVGDIRYVAPGYMIKCPTKYFDMSRVDELQGDLLDYLEIIGNIYQTPDLLKTN